MRGASGLRPATAAEPATVAGTCHRAECAVTLAVRPIPSVCGRAMIFAATVAAVPAGAGTPTGTVTFRADGGPATLATLACGVATFTTGLGAGSHTITAGYSGDAHFHPAPLAVLTTRVWRTGFPGPDEM